MTISDEKLSAFLDAELPEAEMAELRELIANDQSLVDRIAELAAVDAIVSSTYHAIDARPLPQSLAAKLADGKPSNSASDKVVQFPFWKRWQQGLQQHAGLATAAALIIGLGLGLFGKPAPEAQGVSWQAVTVALNQQPSGESYVIGEHHSVTPNLSFTNANDQLCRQFTVSQPQQQQQSIACHNEQGWQLVATLYANPLSANDYQTATSDQAIKQLVDTMAVGNFMNSQQEQQAIDNQWAGSDNSQ